MLTVCLLNWKRPANLRRILSALKRQTVAPQIYLWDNAGDFPADARLAWHVRSSVNMGCWPRWWMATTATTEFVCTLDDDLLPRDTKVLRDACRVLEKAKDPRVIVGNRGKRLIPGVEYGLCPNVRPRRTNQRCHIVKGQFMVMRTAVIAAAVYADVLPVVDRKICDDIIVSAVVGGGRPCHRIPPVLRRRFTQLPQPHALCDQPDHYQQREAARQVLFPDTTT